MAKYPFDIKLGKKAGQTSTRKGVADGTSRAEVDNMLCIIAQMKRNEVAAKARLMRNRKTSNNSNGYVKKYIDKEMALISVMAFAPLEVLTYVMALRMSQGKWELAVKAAERLAPYTNSKAPTQVVSEIHETRYDGLDLDERLKNLTDSLDHINP